MKPSTWTAVAPSSTTVVFTLVLAVALPPSLVLSSLLQHEEEEVAIGDHGHSKQHRPSPSSPLTPVVHESHPVLLHYHEQG
jgi:hypothetical protein